MFNLYRRKAGSLTVFLLLLLAVPAIAQRNNPYYDDKIIHFGFLVGLNASTFQMQHNAANFLQNDTMTYITPTYGPGFHLGIISELRLAEHATLRFTPTLMFSQRNLEYSFVNPLDNNIRSIQVANIDLPLLFKFRSDRIENFRLYSVGGLKYTIDMASQEKVVEDVERVKIIRGDLAYEIGLGIDLYLPFFKFSPEIKFVQGLNNVLVPETHRYSSPLDGLRARTIMISFNFE
jgi:hypothetical protein